MSVINFATKLFTVGETTILKLPKEVSAQLPSRGMVLVEGTINGAHFHTALEPDGKGSHWLNVKSSLLQAAKAKSGDAVSVSLESSKDWPEPNVPHDLQAALKTDTQASAIWSDITPMARWDWIRWIQATNNPATRANHIVVAFSKMKHGTRRPCCFNRSMCTDFSVSKNGVLLDPTNV